MAKQYNHEFNEKTTKEKEMSREDLKFLEIMEHLAVLQEGRYCLKLPFKNKEVCLSNNFAVARQRIQGLRKRFLNNKQLHQEYAGYMNTLMSKNYAEQVPQQQLQCEKGKVWYIPHHSVHHPRKGVLVRFRKEPVAFMGDIQAMFHQVRVSEEHKYFLRFLWWPDGDVMKELVEYRMCVHLFGAVSSPGCAGYVLRKTADDNQSEFLDEVIQSVRISMRMIV